MFDFRCISLIFLLLAAVTAQAADAPTTISFNRDIRPILSDNCFLCHGPDAENRAADLRLDLPETALESAIIPGQPDESPLLERVESTDPDLRMPPQDANLQLTSEQRRLLRQWIQQGASWDQHWSFVPPQPPEPPADTNAADSPIDPWVNAALTQHSLPTQPQAPPPTLLRRLTFDLTGLPPTLEQLDDFVEDPSAAAFEASIDRLLASPQFGERVASVWLDLARYSDTFGYQVDRDRHVWPWRDWVIRAFNNNMPYDQFLTRQLAGDLLPNATDEDVLATTFNRLHPQKVEGGSTPEEFRIEYVADRTQTFATAFLGLTMECCRCHDHKYDPLSQQEYYQLSAFFDNIDESGLYSYHTRSTPTPTLLLMDEPQRQQVQQASAEITAAEQQLQLIRESAEPRFAQWLAGQSEQPANLAPPSIPGRILHETFDDFDAGANQSIAGRHGQGIRFTGDDAFTTEAGRFQRHQPFTISLWLNSPDVKSRAVVWHCSMGWTDAASRGYQLLIKDGRLHASLIHYWPGNAISIATTEALPVNEWKHVTVRYDGSSRASGLSLLIDGQPVATEVIRDQLTKEIKGGKQHLALGERTRDRGFTNGLADELQVFERHLTEIEVRQLADGTSLTKLLHTPPADLNKTERELLRDYYLATEDEAWQKQQAAVQQHRQSANQTMDGLQEIMVMRELPQPRTTFFLHRGAYDARRDAVAPATPTALPSWPENQPPNRLGLAHWLTSPGHPLTARVAVNHFWQMMFGQGLVRTPEDFGSQGRPPTHPELLDWLALDFQQNGWNVKRLLKQIALSRTYQRSSAVTPELLTQDPDNLWLARFPSYRLPAEMLRDNALAVSGLLVNRQGGPPAKPYDVAASFKPVERDKGDGLYRRSVYTYWKRTGPAPAMMVLDAVKRDVCRVSRERTASPLEAFVLMNGPQFVEAARALADHLLQNSNTPEETLPILFRMLTSRPPTEQELQVLQQLFQEQQQYFGDDPERTTKYLAVGDHRLPPATDPVDAAALTAVANALFSFDECLSKR